MAIPTSRLDKVRPYHVAIAGRGFVVDFSQYRRTTMQVRRLATDDSVEPGEQSLSAAGVWPRGQDNWFLGSGQEFLDNRFAFQNVYVTSGEFPSVRTRFYRSKGLNPWVQGGLSLQPSYALKNRSGHMTGANLLMVATATALYVVDNDELYWSSNPSATTPTWTSAGMKAVLGSAITGLTTDGHRVFACDGTHGVSYTDDQGVTSTNLTAGATYAATFLGYASGYLIASTGRDLVEITATGTKNAIFSHPNASFVWKTVCATPTAILVGGYAGAISFIGAIVPSPASIGAQLGPPITATTLPPGEGVNVIVYDAGSLMLGTTLGIRLGTRPDQTGVFDVAPVITQPGNTLCLSPYLQYVYFGWTNYQTGDQVTSPSVGSSGLGRANLAQFTQINDVPAFATDVMATDTITGSVMSVAILAGVPYFSIASNGVWGPDGNVVASGTLESGWIRYGITDAKILTTGTVHHDPLIAGQSITMAVADEFGVNYSFGGSAVVGSTAPAVPFNADLIVGQRFMELITLNRGTDNTKGPTLRAWQVNGMVTPVRQDEIVCPIILKSAVVGEQVDGRKITQNTLDDFNFLKNLEAAGTPFLYQEGDGITEQAYIDQVQMAPNDMNRQRSWFDGICTVKIITLSNNNVPIPVTVVGSPDQGFTKSGSTYTAETSYTITKDVTAGHCLVLQHMTTAGHAISSVVSDDGTLFSLVERDVIAGGMELWVSEPIGAPATLVVTVTLSASDFAQGQLFEIANSIPNASVESFDSDSGSGTLTYDGPSIVPAKLGDLVMQFTAAADLESSVSLDWTSSSFQTPSKSYDKRLLELSPTAWWKLADALGSPTAVDSSGNGYDGTVNGAVTFQQTGPITGTSGKAALFDGSSGYITTPSNGLNRTQFSVVAWYKISAASGGFLLSNVLGNSAGFKLNATTNLEVIVKGSGFSPTTLDLTDPGTSDDGAWHMAVVTADGSNLVLYRDGTAVASGAYSETVSLNNLNLGLFVFGPPPSPRFFAGSGAEIALFNSALTPAQIAELYADKSVAAGSLSVGSAWRNGNNGLPYPITWTKDSLGSQTTMALVLAAI